MNMFVKFITKKYANFSGRASRREFWSFRVFYSVGLILSMILCVSNSPIAYIFFLTYIAITTIPLIAVAVRRLHDTNRSAWYLLISFVPGIGDICMLILYCLRGTTGANQYGYKPEPFSSKKAKT